MAFNRNNKRYFKAECLPERENYCQGISLGNTGNLSYKDGSAVDLPVIARFSAWLPPPSNPPLPVCHPNAIPGNAIQDKHIAQD